MMMFAIGFLAGFYVGIGVMCIAAVAKNADERAEEMRRRSGQPN
jgi:hypothetical protein